MSKISIFCLVSIIAFASGCGNGRDVAKGFRSQFKAQSVEEARELAKSSIVDCANKADCNESVGLITFVNVSNRAINTGMCTGFLIGPNRVLTNSHCIPGDLHVENASCAGRIWIKFPGTNKLSEEMAECSRVITSSHRYDFTLMPLGDKEMLDPTSISADYSVIELQSSLSRKSLEVAPSGFGDEEAFDVYKSDPSEIEWPHGTIKHTRCIAYQNTLALATFDDAQKPIALIDDCEIIHGNSGSPAINSKGKAVGIVFASDPSYKKFAAKIPGWAPYLTESVVGYFNYATSFSCTPDLYRAQGLDFTLPQACLNNDPAFDVNALEKTKPSDLAESLASSNLVKKNPDFHWNSSEIQEGTDEYARLGLDRYKKKQTVAFFTGTPSCVANVTVSRSGGTSKLTTTAPIYRVSVRLNKHLKRSVEIEELFSVPYKVEYNPAELKLGSTSVSVSLGATRETQAIDLRYLIGKCN